MSTEADSVAAWRTLLDAIGAAGDDVAELGTGGADVDLTEGFGYVLTVLGDQLDRAALRSSNRPVFVPGVTPVRKLFFDNPDTDYDTALIRGDRSYRIRGRRGTAAYLAFCVYSGNIARGEQTRVANLSDADMAFAADGTFEVLLSATPHPGNWIPLDADAHAVFARQYFLDRARETSAEYTIELLDEVGPDPVMDGARFARHARRTAEFVGAATAVALERAARGRAHPNQFFEAPGHGIYGTPDAGYAACWYEIAADEALVIEARPPACRYWGAHLANLWGQSLDHRTRRTVLNRRSAEAADGSVRIVVAHHDRGDANWLDASGHAHGWVLFRWLLADRVVIPDARLESSVR